MAFPEMILTGIWTILRLFGLKRKKNISGEAVLITGAGSGLGRLLAVRFAKLGCRLVLWDISASGNEETAKLVKSEGAEVHTYICDVSKRENVYETAKKVKQDVGKISILVNNAGIVTGKPFLDIPDEIIIKVFEVNTFSHFWTCKAFLPEMLADNHGHIVTVSSLAGLGALSQLSEYCASKFATMGFEESLRLELAMKGYNGVKTTVACPFFMSTGMFDGVRSRFFPILEPEYVADRIMSAILKDEVMILLPPYMSIVIFLRTLTPWPLWYKIHCALGGKEAMEAFVGRQKPKTN